MLRETPAFVLAGTQVTCETDIANDLWPVECDEGLISQALSNLIRNAEQAMPAGGAITLRACNVEIGGSPTLPLPRGDYVHIAIQDRGPGIPREHVPRGWPAPTPSSANTRAT